MTYLEVPKRGPFPDHIDPWAESGSYFQQLHAALIDEIFSQIADPFGEALKRFALPLHYEVVPIDLQHAYEEAYQKRIIAAQFEDDGQYDQANLPYPSLLSEKQGQEVVQNVHNWQQLVASLRPKG